MLTIYRRHIVIFLTLITSMFVESQLASEKLRNYENMCHNTSFMQTWMVTDICCHHKTTCHDDARYDDNQLEVPIEYACIKPCNRLNSTYIASKNHVKIGLNKDAPAFLNSPSNAHPTHVILKTFIKIYP